MKAFEDWCRDNGYNPHTFEASDAYQEHLKGVNTMPYEQELEALRALGDDDD